MRRRLAQLGFYIGSQRRNRMRLATGIVSHTNFTMALLHHITEFFETEVRSIQGFAID